MLLASHPLAYGRLGTLTFFFILFLVKETPGALRGIAEKTDEPVDTRYSHIFTMNHCGHDVRWTEQDVAGRSLLGLYGLQKPNVSAADQQVRGTVVKNLWLNRLRP